MPRPFLVVVLTKCSVPVVRLSLSFACPCRSPVPVVRLSLSFASLSASFAVIPSISVPVYNIDVH
jgi:hypothetical protein